MIIDDQQRATIFAQLRKKRKWTGRRNGHRVRIWTDLSSQGVRINYQVTRKNVNVCGSSLSLLRSIACVNEVLEGATPVPGGVPLFLLNVPPPPPPPVRQQWLPYKDD
jgi:hypothetical protein